MPTAPEKPAIIIVYGASKIGKTTDALYTFPQGMFIANERALTPARVLGITPRKANARVLSEIAHLLRQHLAQVAKGKVLPYTAIVIDDISLAAERSLFDYEKQFGPNGYARWNKLHEDISEILRLAEELGVHVLMTAHDRPPRDDLPGGPSMPSATLSAALPKNCDLVLRAVHDPVRDPWPASYECGLIAGGEWTTGDRFGVCPNSAPLNLGEILREIGYSLPRTKALEHFEPLVERGAALLEKGKPQVAVFRGLVKAAKKRREHTHAELIWLLRDTLARYEIREANSNKLSLFGL